MIKFLSSIFPIASILKAFASSRITVACLFLLFILTFWGTIAQVQQGLYVAQERYFNSFFFLAAGYIPFPGAQLVLWVFFVNLICMMILTIKKFTQWENLGLLIIHLGLILYFFAAFMIFHFSKESNVHLAEGEKTNVSTSYQDWELDYWKDRGKERHVTAFDTTNFKSGFQIPFENKDFTLTVDRFYLNSDALSDSSLTEKPINKEREQNIEGGIFNWKANDKSHSLMLYGAASQATTPSEVSWARIIILFCAINISRCLLRSGWIILKQSFTRAQR